MPARRKTAQPSAPPPAPHSPALRFIDLFCGIGGFRHAFEKLGCECVFSSDWDAWARKTYEANFGEEPAGDIRLVHASSIRAHDIVCGGFPCQPFSLAGVSKKNSLGRAHGFDDEKQGNLFYEIVRLLEYHRPAAFVLENVKNLKSHDKGNTFRVIHRTLTEDLGYHVQVQIIDARDHFKKEGIHWSSPSYTGSDDAIKWVRDDTEKAKDYAEAVQRANEAARLSGTVLIPRLTTAYRIGDRISKIDGRDMNFRANSFAENEAPQYPMVVGLDWSFNDTQTTKLILSDRRAEPLRLA